MFVWVALAVLLGTAAASPLQVGGAKCSWGPSYWCANIPQASQCGAVKHCIKAVWEKETVPQDDDEVCEICKEMVGEARDTLLSNETQEELRQVFEGSCDLIPIAIIAKECKTLSDQFIPELVETLASEMNPDTVCTVSGLCNSARIDALLADRQGGGGDCGLCRAGAAQVAARLASSSPAQVEAGLLELCGHLGSFSTACMETVVEQAEDIHQLLSTRFDAEICDLAGLCSQSFASVPARQLQAGEDIQCEFCEKVVQHWVDVYASNSSLAEFKALMDGICDRLDKNNAEHCKHIVDDYYIPAFEFIRNELNPHTLCSLVGLCTAPAPAPALSPALAPVPLVKLVPARVEEKPTCVLCEYVMHQLQDFIRQGQTEAEIKQELQAVCGRMPAMLRKECQTLVNTYEPLIIDYLVSEISPSEVCPMLHLCDGPAGLADPAASSSCEMCEFALTEVFSVLQDPSDQNMVKNVLESICYRLPDSIEQSCENFVDTYTATILQFITNGFTPDEICSALSLCQTAEEAVPAVPAPEEMADTGCVLCEYVITTLDSMLEDKTNKAEIKSDLEKLCSLLPKSVRGQCDNFVETYTDLIIDMLTKDVSPEMVCQNLGLCKQAANVVEQQVLLDTVEDPYCSLCQMVVADLEGTLSDKKSRAEIEDALDVLCSTLSDPVHAQCEKMVAKYTEEIIDMILQEFTPKQMCAELGLCVNNEINTNDIHSLSWEEAEAGREQVGCEMCEFAVTILDEHLTDESTIDEVERMVQFVCSYLPGSVADKCEELVDQYGAKLITALVDKELAPKEVCAEILPDCATSGGPVQRCPWGPELWCSTPFHARVCGATQLCQAGLN